MSAPTSASPHLQQPALFAGNSSSDGNGSGNGSGSGSGTGNSAVNESGDTPSIASSARLGGPSNEHGRTVNPGLSQRRPSRAAPEKMVLPPAALSSSRVHFSNGAGEGAEGIGFSVLEDDEEAQAQAKAKAQGEVQGQSSATSRSRSPLPPGGTFPLTPPLDAAPGPTEPLPTHSSTLPSLSYSYVDTSYPPTPGTGPSAAATPTSTAPLNNPSALDYFDERASEREVERTAALRSPSGMAVMAVTGCAQLIDNLLLTAVNIALPSISKDLNISPGYQSWIMSAYALAFGGFLLLAGVLADRYGRKRIFEYGVVILTIWTLAVSFAPNEVSAIVFRAMQGLGAAATVPSAVGIISTYFTGKDRNAALSLFGAAGAVGFSGGLIFGGLIEAALGWRYIFRLTAVLTSLIALGGAWALPRDTKHEGPKPALDFWGAGLGTGGLVTLVFCLSSGGIYGWGKAFIIALLALSVLALIGFTFAEKKVRNPLMPLSLWRAPNFGASWLCGLLLYCWWQSVVYFMVLIAQNVYHYNSIETAIRFIPIGAISFPIGVSGAWYVERFELKHLVIGGMLGAVIAPIPAALTTLTSSFWTHVFITSILGAIFITSSYTCINIFLISSVPPSAKGLAGGLANTAYQIGSGIGLAVTAAVQQAVAKGAEDPESTEALLKQYKACMWTASGMAGAGLVVILLFLKNVRPVGGVGVVH